MADILLAEDDADVRKWVAVALESEGHSVRVAPDGEAALEAFRARRPDLLVLDVMMPRKDGLEVCRAVRAGDPALPVLMLTARNTEKDGVAGVGVGRGACVPRPFSMGELVARVAALLRRGALVARSAPASSVDLGALRLEPARMALVAADGTATPLAARECGLLRLLAAHPGEVLPRERLLNELWGVSFYGNTRTLDQHVALVRRKLGAEAGRLETVRNVGYRLRVG